MGELKKEYIDLSGMDENEIPETNPEIPEENPSESHLAVGHEGDTSTEQETAEENKEDLSHLMNPDGTVKSEATDEQMKALGVDNPTSYRYFQSEKDKKDAEIRQLREQYERDRNSFDEVKRQIEELRTQSQPKEEPLVPPVKPNSDDPMDMIKWQSDMLEYQNKLINQNQQSYQTMQESWQQEQQRRQQEQQAAQQRAYIEGQFVKVGASPQEAQNILRDFAELQKNPEEYSKFVFNAWKNYKGSPQPPKRTTQLGQAPPLAGVPSQTETQKRDEAEEFFGDQLDFQKRYY